MKRRSFVSREPESVGGERVTCPLRGLHDDPQMLLLSEEEISVRMKLALASEDSG